MGFVHELWLPILLSGVVVWIASAIVWMALPHHKSDFKKLAREDDVTAALKGTGAGLYMLPYCGDMSAMKDPEFKKRYDDGPTGYVILRPAGPFNMGAAMIVSVFYNLVIAFFVAYVASLAITGPASYLHVFRVVGTVTWLAYAGALVYPGIWAGRPWGVIFKEIIDALVYALITAGIFGWLWPGI